MITKGLYEIDLRDWNGLSLNGSNDNSSILQEAITEAGFKNRESLGYGASYRLSLPAGRIAFSSTLTIKQQLWMEGVFGASGGTELWFFGGASDNAIVSDNLSILSFFKIANLRLEDKRTDPTAGRGLSFKRVTNGCSLERIQVIHFPDEQIYFGADPGQSSDCISMNDIWVLSNKTSAKGILIERVDNAVILNDIKSDLAVSPANDGYVIRTQNINNDNAIINISNVKHESNNRCPTITFPVATKGNVFVSNVVQRNPVGGSSGAGDVIQIGAASSGTDYYYNNSATGITTGPASEGGGRLSLLNICGINHNNWTGTSGAATVRCIGTGVKLFGNVNSANLGNSGRIDRGIVSGNGIPNGSVYGNVGDIYKRLDATSSVCCLWYKQLGNATNTGWTPISYETQSIPYSASIATNLQLGNRISVGSLTGNITIANPTNVLPVGTKIAYLFTQDGTGGRSLTWGSLFKGAWPTASGTANQKIQVNGESDGTNIIYSFDSSWY